MPLINCQPAGGKVVLSKPSTIGNGDAKLTRNVLLKLSLFTCKSAVPFGKEVYALITLLPLFTAPVYAVKVSAVLAPLAKGVLKVNNCGAITVLFTL